MDKPAFRQGDRVEVSLKGMEGRRGTVVGKTFDHVIDMWLVDFGEIISEVYPYTTASIPHPQMRLIEGNL